MPNQKRFTLNASYETRHSFAFTMALESVNIYNEALIYIRKRGALIGLDSCAADYKPLNFLLVLCVFDAITYTMVTIYCGFEFFGDLEKIVFCLVTYGFGIQVSSFHRQTTFDNLFAEFLKATNLLAWQRKAYQVQSTNHTFPRADLEPKVYKNLREIFELLRNRLQSLQFSLHCGWNFDNIKSNLSEIDYWKFGPSLWLQTADDRRVHFFRLHRKFLSPSLTGFSGREWICLHRFFLHGDDRDSCLLHVRHPYSIFRRVERRHWWRHEWFEVS